MPGQGSFAGRERGTHPLLSSAGVPGANSGKDSKGPVRTRRTATGMSQNTGTSKTLTTAGFRERGCAFVLQKRAGPRLGMPAALFLQQPGLCPADTHPDPVLSGPLIPGLRC